MPRVAPTVALIPAPRPLFITDQLCEACGDGGAEDSQVVCENGDPAKHTGWVWPRVSAGCQPRQQLIASLTGAYCSVLQPHDFSISCCV